MKALQIVGRGTAEMVDIPDPTPAGDEVVIEVEAVTTCPQWDLHILDGDPMFPGEPIEYPYTPGQPGHEAVGRVVAVGADVTEFAVGQRVAAWRALVHDRPGCYAEYVALPATHVLPIADDLDALRIGALELAMCVRVSFELLERMDAVTGKRFGVSGLGPSGLVAAQMARAGGASEIVGFDLSTDRLKAGLDLGCDIALDPRDCPPLDSNAHPDALDAAIDCVGNPTSVQFLMDRTREAVALFGVLREPVQFGWRHWPGLMLLGYRPHHRGAAEAAVSMITEGSVDLRSLVSTTMPLADYSEGVGLLRRQEAIKVCFTP